MRTRSVTFTRRTPMHNLAFGSDDTEFSSVFSDEIKCFINIILHQQAEIKVCTHFFTYIEREPRSNTSDFRAVCKALGTM